MSKRVIDVALSLLLFVAFAPVMIVIALIVLVIMGRPVIFQQTRSGLHGKPFVLYKFRTMRQNDHGCAILSDKDRLTFMGRILRSTSLDELPELFNVLKGDMSLVGPRPLLMEYLPLYTSEQMHRHAVRPGITGWAQVNGRNSLAWDEKFKLDVWYVDNRSFWLDIRILAMTVYKAFSRHGISASGEATMPKFTGNKS